MVIQYETLRLLAEGGDVQAQLACRYYNLLQVSPAIRGRSPRLTIRTTPAGGFVIDAPGMTNKLAAFTK